MADMEPHNDGALLAGPLAQLAARYPPTSSGQTPFVSLPETVPILTFGRQRSGQTAARALGRQAEDSRRHAFALAQLLLSFKLTLLPVLPLP